MRIARYAAVLLVFVAPGVASAANEIVGTWTAARTGHQIRVTRTGTRTFAGAVVKAYTLGPCTNRAGRVVWTHLERVRPGRYNCTWARLRVHDPGCVHLRPELHIGNDGHDRRSVRRQALDAGLLPPGRLHDLDTPIPVTAPRRLKPCVGSIPAAPLSPA